MAGYLLDIMKRLLMDLMFIFCLSSSISFVNWDIGPKIAVITAEV